MSNFSNFIVTDEGREIISKANSNTENGIVYTKFIGTESIYTLEELSSLTELNNPKQEIPVISAEFEYPDKARVSGKINSLNVEEGYFLQTIGLYAKNKIDNIEVLYAVSIEIDTEKANWIPAKNSSNIVDTVITGIFVILKGQIESIQINPGDYVSSIIFEEHLKNNGINNVHNSTSDPTEGMIIARDMEGCARVNMPSGYIPDTTIVNHKYMVDTFATNNQYIKEIIQTGLDKKQDKLTAGSNVEITKNNVINVFNNIPTKAELVSFDNSEAQLRKIIGYDFPKFKAPVPESINLVLTDIQDITEYPATITKQSNGSYILNADLNDIQSAYGNALILKIKNVNGDTQELGILNIINIFWNIVTSDEWTANNSDIVIEGITAPLQFEFIHGNLLISKTDLSPFEQKPYNITLTIKNRQFHSPDEYFLGIGDYTNTNFLSYLNLENNITYVRLVGTIKGSGTGTASSTKSYYSFPSFLSNYFNLASSESYINTTEITSSTGKAVKYYFRQNTSNEDAVDLIIAYQDGSTINLDDLFRIFLTPDKNAALNPIYQNVTNVQQMGEALNEKISNIYDSSGAEIIINDKATINGVRKTIYRRFFVRDIELIQDNLEHHIKLSHEFVNRDNIVNSVFLIIGIEQSLIGFFHSNDFIDYDVTVYSTSLYLTYTCKQNNTYNKLIYWFDYYK